MAKNRSLLLAGLAAGAYAYFRKKENRDKAMEAFNNTKNKVNSFMEAQKQGVQEEGTGNPNPYHEEDSNMVSEGAMTSVKYYNEEEAETKNVSSDKDSKQE
ncbi:MAG: hypothetical protein ABS934_00260 [Psychrobacillus sp.]